MPIYEYRCSHCGADFEKLVAGQRAVECPECKSTAVRRTLSLFGVKSDGTDSSRGASSACGCGSCSCGAAH